MERSPFCRQVSGSHYANRAMQPIIFIRANNYDFCAGNILKYLVRWRHKGGVSDLHKAVHYAEFRRDLGIARKKSAAVRVLERWIDRIWNWRNKAVWAEPISMSTFVRVNVIGTDDDHVFYALHTWVIGGIGSDMFMQILRQYVISQEQAPNT